MYAFTVTPEFLVVLFAGLAALAFDYFPGLAAWYDAFDAPIKKRIMAVVVLLFAVVIFAGQCWGLFATNLTCELKSAFDLGYIVFIAVGVNQGAHLLMKPSEATKAKMFGVG
jgi:hypothetical protein